MSARNCTFVRCLRIAQWPLCDQHRWQSALLAGDALDPGGVASRWSESTRRKVISGWGRFLFWLSQRGDLEPTSTPESRVTRERLTEYLDHLRQMSRGHTVQCRVQEVGDALRALAPAADWHWILRAAARLRASTIPARDKRSRLRPIQQVLASGFRLIRNAEHNQDLSDLGRAALYRDGLILALFAAHPLRLRNFATLRIGHHVVEQGETFMLKIPASETKGRRPYEATLSEDLSRAVGWYLRQHRPVLLAARGRWRTPAGDTFWISKDGSPCSEATFRNVLRRHTCEPNKKPLTPHLLRSCAATTIAVEAPQSVGIIPAVLGHGSPATSECYYTLATGVEASRAYDKMLTAILRGASRKVRQDRVGASRSRALRNDR